MDDLKNTILELENIMNKVESSINTLENTKEYYTKIINENKILKEEIEILKNERYEFVPDIICNFFNIPINTILAREEVEKKLINYIKENGFNKNICNLFNIIEGTIITESYETAKILIDRIYNYN